MEKSEHCCSCRRPWNVFIPARVWQQPNESSSRGPHALFCPLWAARHTQRADGTVVHIKSKERLDWRVAGGIDTKEKESF